MKVDVLSEMVRRLCLKRRPEITLKVLEHKKEIDPVYGTLLNHSAIVELDKEDKKRIGSCLPYRTSVNVGYHPTGYGIFNECVKEIDDKRYLVSWTTSASCD